MTAERDLTTEALAIADELHRLAADLLPRTASETLERLRSVISEQRGRVVLCGEFDHGKSTLANALMRCPRLLAEGNSLATSVATVLSDGQVPAAHVVRLVNGLFERERIPMATLHAVTTADRAEDVVAVEVVLPSPFLKDGVILVDPPGFERLDAHHTVVAMSALAEADAVLLVARIQTPLSRGQLDAFKDAVGTDKPFVLVLTQSDDVEDDEDEATRVRVARHRLAATLGRDEASVPVMPVSAHLAMDAMVAGRADERRSQVPELGAYVRDVLLSRVRLGLLRRQVLPGFAELLRLAIASVTNALDLLRDGPSRVETEEFLRDAHARLVAVQTGERHWAPQLATDIDRVIEQVRSRLVTRLAGLRRELAMTDVLYSRNPDAERWIRWIQHETVMAVADADRTLRRGLAKVADDWSARTSVHLTRYEPVRRLTPNKANLSLGPFAAQPQNVVRRRLASVLWGFTHALDESADGAQLGGLIGTAIGGTPGAVTGGFIGAVIGAFIGWIRDGREHFAQARRQHFDDVMAKLRAAVDKHDVVASKVLAEIQVETQKRLTGEILDQARAEQSVVDGPARQSSTGGQDALADAATLTTLNDVLKRLNALVDRVAAATAAVDAAWSETT